IDVPIDSKMVPVFALDGDARFSFGGGVGFQLESLQLNGVSVFNGNTDPANSLNTLSITPPTTPVAPTADLYLPYDGEAVTDAELTAINNQHYFDVQFTDYSGTGINSSSVTAATVKLSGAGASGVSVTSVTADPSTPGLFRFNFSGSFATSQTDPYSTVTVTFVANGFADNKGDRNVASSQSFYLADVPTAKLASPKNGATIGLDALTERPYLDVTFDPGTDGATVDGSTINGGEVTLTISPTAGGAAQTIALLSPIRRSSWPVPPRSRSTRARGRSSCRAAAARSRGRAASRRSRSRRPTRTRRARRARSASAR